MIPDEIYNHKWRPNYRCDYRELLHSGLEGHTAYYNSQGWRQDFEVSQRKPQGVYRIFFVGDSFTAGTCAPELSMPSIVRKSLEEEKFDRKIEVINTGTSSYSPSIYYLLIKNIILNYHADLVIINIDMTDVFDDYLYKAIEIKNDLGEVIAYPAFSLFSNSYTRTPQGLRRKGSFEVFLNYLGQYSKVLYEIHSRLSAYNDSHAKLNPIYPEVFEWTIQPRPERSQEFVRHSITTLEKSLRILKDRDVKVILTAVPHREQLKGEGKYSSVLPFQEISELADKYSVKYFDSFSVMKNAMQLHSLDALFAEHDWHYSKLGYKMWGEGYVDFILTQNLIASKK
jgi:lysophospholipase L1-like esterase